MNGLITVYTTMNIAVQIVPFETVVILSVIKTATLSEKNRVSIFASRVSSHSPLQALVSFPVMIGH